MLNVPQSPVNMYAISFFSGYSSHITFQQLCTEILASLRGFRRDTRPFFYDLEIFCRGWTDRTASMFRDSKGIF
jgi:hypothetical protein